MHIISYRWDRVDAVELLWRSIIYTSLVILYQISEVPRGRWVRIYPSLFCGIKEMMQKILFDEQWLTCNHSTTKFTAAVITES